MIGGQSSAPVGPPAAANLSLASLLSVAGANGSAANGTGVRDVSSSSSSDQQQTNDTQADEPEPLYMQNLTVILCILHFSVFVTGLIGNSLVCLSVYRNKSLQTVTNYYIVNLAVADFLVILICLPPTVYWDITLTWNFGLVACKLVLYLQVSHQSHITYMVRIRSNSLSLGGNCLVIDTCAGEHDDLSLLPPLATLYYFHPSRRPPTPPPGSASSRPYRIERPTRRRRCPASYFVATGSRIT